MEVVHGIAGVPARMAEVRKRGVRIAFVPTMGNLHAGHLALVARAREAADFTAVSIFVNPFQFGEGEDYATYPRTLEADAEQLRAAGADFLFVPEVSQIYPSGAEHHTRIEVPELSTLLCGAHRPGFFRGVTTIVGILFNLVRPDAAVFGEKDYQQLIIIARMVRDLAMAVEIIPAPTVRESDGLAMSSRNAYLSAGERQQAPALYRSLSAARDAIAQGETDYEALESKGLADLQEAGLRPDYFAIRAAADLAPPASGSRDLRVLAAAWLGKARLIDNVGL